MSNITDLPEGAQYGVLAFAEERERQVSEKGYTIKHDDGHDPDDLLAAGLSYIEWAHWDLEGTSGDSPPFNWPWEAEAWNPEDSALENMVKGGALVAAAYDRLYRESLGRLA